MSLSFPVFTPCRVPTQVPRKERDPSEQAPPSEGTSDAPTRSGGPARSLDNPATFVVDAAHNGFTLHEAHALYLEKRHGQAFRIMSRPLPRQEKGDLRPSHWNNEWQIFWDKVSVAQKALAEVKTPAHWKAYRAQGFHLAHWYQLAVPSVDHPAESFFEEMALPASQDHAIRWFHSWVQLARWVQRDQTVILPPATHPMPRRWTMNVARRIIARWMRRVGLQVIQWPWSAGQDSHRLWVLFCAMRRLQQRLVARTGWHGPVMGLGGGLWWTLGSLASCTSGGWLQTRHGIPQIHTGGMEWVEAFYHEWFHALEVHLLHADHPNMTSKGLVVASEMASDEIQNNPGQERTGKRAQAVMQATRELYADIQATSASPIDQAVLNAWEEQSWLTLQRLRQPLNMGSVEARLRHQKRWGEEGLTPRMWVRQAPWRSADEKKDRDLRANDHIQLVFSALSQEVPMRSWFARLHVVLGLDQKLRPMSKELRKGTEWTWWGRYQEHLAMAFEFDELGWDSRVGWHAKAPTPAEARAMRPAFDRYFQTLRPIWRQMVHLRQPIWHHHPFPFPAPVAVVSPPSFMGPNSGFLSPFGQGAPFPN